MNYCFKLQKRSFFFSSNNDQFVGCDPKGNLYFEVVKNGTVRRQVKYYSKEYDPSLVHPLWWPWLNYKSDIVPSIHDIQKYDEEKMALQERVLKIQEKERLEREVWQQQQQQQQQNNSTGSNIYDSPIFNIPLENGKSIKFQTQPPNVNQIKVNIENAQSKFKNHNDSISDIKPQFEKEIKSSQVNNTSTNKKEYEKKKENQNEDNLKSWYVDHDLL